MACPAHPYLLLEVFTFTLNTDLLQKCHFADQVASSHRMLSSPWQMPWPRFVSYHLFSPSVPPKRCLITQTFLAKGDVQKETSMLTEYSLRVGECRQTVDNECLRLLLFVSVHYRRPYAPGLVFYVNPSQGYKSSLIPKVFLHQALFSHPPLM